MFHIAPHMESNDALGSTAAQEACTAPKMPARRCLSPTPQERGWRECGIDAAQAWGGRSNDLGLRSNNLGSASGRVENVSSANAVYRH